MADPVNFNRPAAERIARVVRAVEFGTRDGSPLEIDRPWDAPVAVNFRICTFTGAWTKEALKVVTYKYKTSTPNTATAVNLFANISASSANRNCAIAREGTAWYLIAAEC